MRQIPEFRLLPFLLSFVVSALCASAASAQPDFSKSFNPPTIGPGSVSTLTFTIDNSGGPIVQDLAFVDTLPSAVVIATPANAFTDCPNGILAAPGGGSTITLTDGDVAPGTVCSVSIDVTSATPGVHMNISGDLTSTAGNSGTAVADLTVATNLPGFSKSFSPTTLGLGGRSTLTFTIDNTLNGAQVFSLTFTDNLPAGLVVASPANAVNTCAAGFFTGGLLTANPGSNLISLGFGAGADVAAVGAGATCTIMVDVTATGGGTLFNSTSNLQSSNGSAGKATAALSVPIEALTFSKRFIDDPVPAGSTVELEFTIFNNNRTDSATNIAFTDDLDGLLTGLAATGLPANNICGAGSQISGTGLLTFTGGNLPPEGSCTFSVTLQIPAAATSGGYPNITSTISGDVGGNGVVSAAATDTLFVEPVPVLTKEFLQVGTLTPDPVVGAGEDVVIRFTIDNTSTVSAATDIEFVDELTTFLPFPVAVTLPPVPDPPCGAGSSLTLISLGTGRQGLLLSAGNLTAAGMAGDSCTFDVTLTIPNGLPGGIYLNTTEPITATVDGATRTGEPAGDDLTIVNAPRLEKEFTDDPADPGGTVTLQFTLTHDDLAPGDATNITFTDDLNAVITGLAGTGLPLTNVCGPGNGTVTGSAGDTLLTFSGGTLMPGEVCVFSVTLNVPVAATAGTYTNTTSGVSADVLGATASGNPASGDLTISGLMLSKEFLGDPVLPGDSVTLQFTLENMHPTDDATAIFFTDNLADVLPGAPDLMITTALPAPFCGGTLSNAGSFLIFTGGAVTSGSTCAFDVGLLVPAGAPDGIFSNITSSVTATFGGSSTVSDPAVDNLTVNSTLLALTKAFTNDPVAPGGTANLRFTLSNLDAGQAISDIAFTDDLGAALTGLVATGLPIAACGGTVAGIPDAGTIDFSGGTLAAGAQCQFDVSVTVPGGAMAGSYTNTTSTISGLVGGLPVSGDTASDALKVVDLLLFSKSFDGPTVPLGTPVLTFTITNPGAGAVSDLAFSDNLNAVSGLIATNTPLSNVCGPGSMITGTSFLTLTGGNLPGSGGMCSFDINLFVPGTATPGTFPNVTSDLFRAGLSVATPAMADLVIDPPPTFAKVFAPAFIGLGFTSTLTFTIDNTASGSAASNMAFVDNLPAGLVIATPANASNTCGGTLSAPDGGGTINLSNGSVGAAAGCTIQVDVLGSSVGAHVNTTNPLTSSSGNSGTASDTLTVNPQPSFAKSFGTDPIAFNQPSTLTFTLDNSGSTVAATGLDFTDNLPAGLIIATPANASTTCTGGTVTATAGTTVISYTGGTVAAASSCTVQAEVTGSTAGTFVNLSGDLTSSLGNSGTATDTLTVNPPPTFAKAFSPSTIVSGATSTLILTIDNAGATAAATGLDVTDNLPAGVVVATPANASTTCTGGTLTATAGTGVISYTGGSVAAGASCTVQADVTSMVVGMHVNLTGDLTSSLGNSGTATDTLTVDLIPPTFTKAFVPTVVFVGQSSTLTLTIDNPNDAGLGSLAVTDNLPAGMVVATPANGSSTCTGGTLTAAAGAAIITYSGGTVAAMASCTITVDVTGTTAGILTNTTGNLTSDAGSSGTASADLTVAEGPGFTKAFLAPSLPGGSTILEYTLTNNAATLTLDSLAFTDDLDAAISGLAASGLPANNICGAGSQINGTSTLTFTGGTLAPGASCTFQVDITVPADATVGTYPSTSGQLTAMASGEPLTDGIATADLEVIFIELTKSFVSDPVLGDTTTPLTFTLFNPDLVNAADDLAFTDDLDAVLPGMVAVNLPLSAVCGPASSLTGTSVISFTGGSLAPGAMCTFEVDVLVPADAPDGDFTNITSVLSGSVGGAPVTGDASSVATAVLTLSQNPIAIPALGTFGIWMLCGLLGLLAMARIRRS